MTAQNVDLIADYNGVEVKVMMILGDMADVYPNDPADRKPWMSGHKRDSGMDRWVKIDELQPAECDCRVDGPMCRACQDWSRLTTGDEMPY